MVNVLSTETVDWTDPVTAPVTVFRTRPAGSGGEMLNVGEGRSVTFKAVVATTVPITPEMV